MLRISTKLNGIVLANSLSKRGLADLAKLSSLVDIKPDVREALLKTPQKVVALESTIITHGMPYPKNLETALEVEQVIRKTGAIPATIGIVDGRIKIGLDSNQLTTLAKAGKERCVKTSRRDLSYVVSRKLSGGTTVAGTLAVANMVGIRIFATGGVGGVHRGGEQSMDISADLIELGRTPVAVVSSGVKSILDIQRTLEFLETQGVCVVSYQCPDREFPAFYFPSSGSKADYNLNDAVEAAQLIHTNKSLGMQSGFLIGVPLPDEYAIDRKLIDEAIEQALTDAGTNFVVGKEMTPFVLEAISKRTEGRSVESNIALIKNNARVAAEIALELNRLENCASDVKIGEVAEPLRHRAPVVIGGSIIDTCITVQDDDLKLDGATYHATVDTSCGGVGRNIAEGIWKIFGDVNLISAVGNDRNGDYIKRLLPNHCAASILTTGTHPTANCSVLLDNTGDCKLVVGDMTVHSAISTDWIHAHANLIQDAPLVIMDANISEEAMRATFDLCLLYEKPVFFEPTDMRFAAKPFNASDNACKVIRFITPNLYELREIAKHLGFKEHPIANKLIEEYSELDDLLQEVRSLGTFIVNHVDNVIVTLGYYGIAIVRRACEKVAFFDSTETYQRRIADKPQMRFYPGRKLDYIVNVSGAGDSFSSGFISAMLDRRMEPVCVEVGFEAACCALSSKGAVAELYFGRNHPCWDETTGARFITIEKIEQFSLN